MGLGRQPGPETARGSRPSLASNDFKVVRAIYWSADALDLSPIPVFRPIRVTLYACLPGIFHLGLFPGPLVRLAGEAVGMLR